MSGSDRFRSGLPALEQLRLTHPRAHMVGVAGSGMAPLAEILAAGGLTVTGSDPKDGATARHLAGCGVRVHRRHDARNVPAVAMVVHTSAVRADHPELRAAAGRGQPILPRGELLALLMKGASGLGIAGAHGKSTTTGMLAAILAEAGLDPWAAVGARLPGGRGNARVGSTSLLVAEVDESDGTIDRVEPWVVAITNVDREHLDRFGTFARLVASFASLAERVPIAGTVVASADDPRAVAACRNARARRLTAGLGGDAHVCGEGAELHRGCARFTLNVGGRKLGRVTLRVPGMMNARNAIVASAVATALDVPARAVTAALADFTGVGRRFERRGTFRGVSVVDDYAHHPREVGETLRAARAAFPGRRLVAIFEPHRPSRLAAHVRGFATELAGADLVVVAPLYGAFESKAPERDGLQELGRLLGKRVPTRFASTTAQTARLACSAARRGDVLLVMGAGHAEQVADLVVAGLEER